MTAPAGSKPRAQVAARGRGRIRAKVSRDQRDPARLEEVRRRLEQHPGVSGVDVHAQSGSVIVHGQDTDRLHEALSEALDLVDVFTDDKPSEKGVDNVVSIVRSTNRRVLGATGGRVNLKWLVPATFVGVGVRQLLVEGLTVGAVPWYVLLYYGADSFLKLYPEHAPKHENELESLHAPEQPQPAEQRQQGRPRGPKPPAA